MRTLKFEHARFTASHVMNIIGVPYQTLNYWVKIGVVRPSIRGAQGSGTRRVYNFDDLVTICIASRLRQAGLFGTAIINVLELIRQAGFRSKTTFAIGITPAGEVVLNSEKEPLMGARRRPGQLLLFDFSFDCWEVAEELDRLLKKAGFQILEATPAAKKKPVMRAGSNQLRPVRRSA
jgi:DNA-binding transcriptional MerR regulator